MNEKLILADGTEINGNAILSGECLILTIYEKTLAEVFGFLIDPDKTMKIRTEEYGEQTTYTGYNHLYSVIEESGGMICAGLKKN